MNANIHELEKYLRQALGVNATTTPWRKSDRLPHFLNARYGFAQMQLLGTPCLLMIDTSRAEESPAAIRKHLDLLRAKQDAQPIYVRSRVTAYNRKRLIDQKVPFIIPGNQMYLPMLAIDLREHFRQFRMNSPAFSPATQAVVIYALLQDVKDELVPLDMSRRLGYSPMTMTRAFDEIEDANLAVATVRGRERRLRLPAARRETWDKALPFLRSPMKKDLLIRHVPSLTGTRAGLTALAHYSMLSPPEHASVALSRQQWQKFHRHHKMIPVPSGEPDRQEIQVWSYPPALFANGDMVDPLSLYLSLKDDTDERTQTSLDEMMGKLGW